MRYSPEHKARTREKIVKAACRCFREQGIKGVSIADLMEAMGLTHGGFYSHFASKDALVAEAITKLLEHSQQYLETWGKVPAGKQPLDVIVDNYLSKGHRDNPAAGCPLPILGPEIARGSPEVRSALTTKVKDIVELLDRFAASGNEQSRETIAVGVLAAIVGGMVLARATNDEHFSDAILSSCRAFLKNALQNQTSGAGVIDAKPAAEPEPDTGSG
jgi:TetR/AcrR family transcriptional repressor of nem operon